MRSPVVIGVVSAGTNCGETGVASRYTRVGKMTDWIARVLRGVERPVAPPARR
jgi:secreted trypsin-like serine protease